MTAGDVMDTAAALLNDVGKSQYTYVVQLPQLKVAYSELSEFFQDNNIPSTNALSAVVEVTTSMRDIGGSTGPALPSDLVEIQGVYERDFGSTQDFTEVKKVDYLPETSTLNNLLTWWAWQNQIIKFLGALTNRDVQIRYIANSFASIVDQSSGITIINAKNFLAFRTAGLCAKYIGENPTRADALNGDASMALDRLLNLSTKGRQVMPVRRRPFMAGYKSLGRY